MTWRYVVAATGLLVAPHAAAADEVAIEDFFGQWRGAELSVDGTEQAPKLGPSDLDMAIDGADAGFQLRTFALAVQPDGTLGARPIEATFAPTETPGVYAFAPNSGSLLSSLFADPAVGNPLEGDTLLWARLQGDTLHIYRLAIDADGGFVLEQSSAQLLRDGMVTRYQLRRQNDRIITVEARHERAED